MPRLDYRASVESELRGAEGRMVLAILLDEINQLRFWVGKPQLTEEHVQAKIRQYRRQHPRVTSGPREE